MHLYQQRRFLTKAINCPVLGHRPLLLNIVLCVFTEFNKIHDDDDDDDSPSPAVSV